MCANDGIIKETEYLKVNFIVPVELKTNNLYESYLTSDLDSLLLSLQKYFCDDDYTQTAGAKNKFNIWMKHEYPLVKIYDLGRKGTGNRMDMAMSLGYYTALMYKYYLEYVIINSSKEETTINKVIRLKLASVYIRAAVLTRARLWIKLYHPFRNLCQADLKDFYISDMGLVCDTLWRSAGHIAQTPRLASTTTFRPFGYSLFPSLKAFDAEDKNRRSREKNIREVACIYNEDEPEDTEEIIDYLMVSHAEGIMKCLFHNTQDWLTHLDGSLSTHKWTDEMKLDARSWCRENIKLCESVFARVDHIHRKSKSFKIETVDGVVRAMMCDLFKEPICSVFTHEHKECLLDFLFDHRDFFKEQRNSDLKRQQDHKLRETEKKNLEAKECLEKEVIKMISVFYLPRIKSYKELNTVLTNFPTKAAKLRVLTKQYLIYVDGFDWKQYKKPMTSKHDRSVGGVEDLTERLKNILGDINEKVMNVPTEPSTLSTQTVMSKFEAIGYATCHIYQEIVGKQIGEVVPVISERMKSYTNLYAPKIPPKFDQLREIIWPKELTKEEKQFLPCTRVEWTENENKIKMEVVGILWDDDELQYVLFMWDITKRKPMHMGEVNEHAYFNDREASIDHAESLSIYKFDNFKIY